MKYVWIRHYYPNGGGCLGIVRVSIEQILKNSFILDNNTKYNVYIGSEDEPNRTHPPLIVGATIQEIQKYVKDKINNDNN